METKADMKKKLSVCSLHVYIEVCGRTCPLSQHIVSVGVQSLGIDVLLGVVGRGTPYSGGVVAHKVVLSGVLCVYLIHDCF